MQKTIIIIPCFNESNRINKKVFNAFLANNPSIFLFFVDDGSSDNTFQILSDLAKNNKNAYCYRLANNSGKAEAIRQSALSILQDFSFSYIGYFDADLSTSLDYIISFQEILDNSEKYQAVIGSRIKRLGSTISRSPLRHFFGRIVATIASNILSLPVYDTQCGAKLFKVDFTKNIFESPFYTKWLFDIEIFARLNRTNGLEIVSQSIYEYPLEEWIDEGDSRIKLKDFIRVPIDILRIIIKYRR